MEQQIIVDDFDDKACRCHPRYGCKQENTKRGNWILGFQSTIALTGAIVGAGNVWAFPYQLYAYSVVFLVPYTLFMVLFALPILYLEMSMGQFSSSGVLTCWMIPIFKAVGFAILSYIMATTIILSGIGSYWVYYLYECIKSVINDTQLPWTNYEYVSDIPGCTTTTYSVDYEQVSDCSAYPNSLAENGVCWHTDSFGQKDYPEAIYDLSLVVQTYANDTSYLLFDAYERTSAEAFLSCVVMGKDFALTDPNGLNLTLVLCFLVLWLAVFIGVVGGVKSIGMITMITVPASFAIMLVLLVRASTLPGFSEGLQYLFVPNYGRLADIGMWISAGNRALYSTSLLFGTFITYGSYNRFHSDFVWDFSVAWLLDYVISIIGSIMVIGFIAFSAYNKGLSIDEVMNSGLRLACVALPDSFDDLPVSVVWNILWFLMLTLFICHSLYGLVETVVTAVLDQFKAAKWRPLVAAIFCVIFFLLGLPICTNSGSFWISLVDINIFPFATYIVFIFMLICYVWYAIATGFRYRHDVKAITGWNCCCVPSVCGWAMFTGMIFFGLILDLFLLITTGINHDNSFHEPYPKWASQDLAYAILLMPIVVLVLAAIIHLIVTAVRKNGKVVDLFKVSKNWKPALQKHQQLVEKYQPGNQSSQNALPLVIAGQGYPVQQGYVATPQYYTAPAPNQQGSTATPQYYNASASNQPVGNVQGYPMSAPQYSGIPESTLSGHKTTVPVYYDPPSYPGPATEKSNIYPDIDNINSVNL